MESSATMKQFMSPDIKELIAALCKAQGVMKPAVFNKVNPHFKNKYADFTSCMECCREPLASNGLSVMQYCSTINEKLVLVTMLAHVSGQWIQSHFPLNPMKMDSQSIGSAMSYGKRYSLSALVGIVSEDDDDGEAAHGRHMQNGSSYQAKAQVIAGPVVASEYPAAIHAQHARSKISDRQRGNLMEIDRKLDDACRGKIYAWLASQYKINHLGDVTNDMYEKVLVTLENALKFMEQSKLEVAQV